MEEMQEYEILEILGAIYDRLDLGKIQTQKERDADLKQIVNLVMCAFRKINELEAVRDVPEVNAEPEEPDATAHHWLDLIGLDRFAVVSQGRHQQLGIADRCQLAYHLVKELREQLDVVREHVTAAELALRSRSDGLG